MSTASELLDAILAESDEDPSVGQYSVEDALNDKSDFTVDDPTALATSPATATDASTQKTPVTESSNSPKPLAPTPTSSPQLPLPSIAPKATAPSPSRSPAVRVFLLLVPASFLVVHASILVCFIGVSCSNRSFFVVSLSFVVGSCVREPFQGLLLPWKMRCMKLPILSLVQRLM